MCFKKAGGGRQFFPVSSNVETVDDLAMVTFNLDPKGRFNVSLWVLTATSILLVSNVVYMVAFLTNGWGTVDVVNLSNKSDHWDFGLWQCCRKSDGLCIGPRWPEYYSATRAFGVIGLFGHVLATAWLIGYAVEKLLDYDECALGSLTSLSFFTGICILIQVCVFGTMWPEDMRNEFQDLSLSIDAKLSYSYTMTCLTIFFLFMAGVLEIVEIRSSLLRLAAKLQAENMNNLEKVEAPEVLRHSIKRRKKEQVELVQDHVELELLNQSSQA